MKMGFKSVRCLLYFCTKIIREKKNEKMNEKRMRK